MLPATSEMLSVSFLLPGLHPPLIENERSRAKMSVNVTHSVLQQVSVRTFWAPGTALARGCGRDKMDKASGFTELTDNKHVSK